jgi:N-acyl-D-aspartate/D-glutamate deacylase
LAAFDAIAEGYVEDIDPTEYERIPLEGIQLFDLLIEDALIYNGKNQGPFRGDIGINISREWKEAKTVLTGTIEDIGDLSITSARTVVKGDNLIVTPGFIILSDDPPEEAIKKGITTPIKSSHSAANDLSGYPLKRQIDPKLIYSHTGEPAKILGLKNKGIIDIDKSADLLIFQSKDSQKQLLDELLYVIKNGQIVFRGTKD